MSKILQWKAVTPGQGQASAKESWSVITDKQSQLLWRSQREHEHQKPEKSNHVSGDRGIRVLETLKKKISFSCFFFLLLLYYCVQISGPQRKSVGSKKSEKHAVRVGRASADLNDPHQPYLGSRC